MGLSSERREAKGPCVQESYDPGGLGTLGKEGGQCGHEERGKGAGTQGLQARGSHKGGSWKIKRQQMRAESGRSVPGLPRVQGHDFQLGGPTPLVVCEIGAVDPRWH